MTDQPSRYLILAAAPFPKRWRDPLGPIRVICEPAEGYVMARRPGGMPFVLAVSDLCNATSRPPHGPFTVEAKTRRVHAEPLP